MGRFFDWRQAATPDDLARQTAKALADGSLVVLPSEAGTLLVADSGKLTDPARPPDLPNSSRPPAAARRLLRPARFLRPTPARPADRAPGLRGSGPARSAGSTTIRRSRPGCRPTGPSRPPSWPPSRRNWPYLNSTTAKRSIRPTSPVGRGPGRHRRTDPVARPYADPPERRQLVDRPARHVTEDAIRHALPGSRLRLHRQHLPQPDGRGACLSTDSPATRLPDRRTAGPGDMSFHRPVSLPCRTTRPLRTRLKRSASLASTCQVHRMDDKRRNAASRLSWTSRGLAVTGLPVGTRKTA